MLKCFFLGHYWSKWMKLNQYREYRECLRCLKLEVERNIEFYQKQMQSVHKAISEMWFKKY